MQRLQNPSHGPILALDRLVRVGVRSHCNDRRAIGLGPKLPFQNLGSLRPSDEPRFKVESRRKSEKGVCGTRKAVDAAMFASPVGIDRLIETYVRRAVARDHAPRPLDCHFGAQRRKDIFDWPAVVKGLALLRLEPVGRVRPGGATDRPESCQMMNLRHTARIEHTANIINGDGFSKALSKYRQEQTFFRIIERGRECTSYQNACPSTMD